jgi:hypothetical protein
VLKWLVELIALTGFVSGHGFSHAEKNRKTMGFNP